MGTDPISALKWGLTPFLVGRRELLEGREGFGGVFALAQLEGVEAHALHEEQVVARELAHGAQLALIAVARAQQARERVAAAVAELGEVNFNNGYTGQTR